MIFLLINFDIDLAHGYYQNLSVVINYWSGYLNQVLSLVLQGKNKKNKPFFLVTVQLEVGAFLFIFVKSVILLRFNNKLSILNMDKIFFVILFFHREVVANFLP